MCYNYSISRPTLEPLSDETALDPEYKRNHSWKCEICPRPACRRIPNGTLTIGGGRSWKLVG